MKDDHDALSYAALVDSVVAAGSGLAALGVGPGDRVALVLPNSAAFVTTALGCLWLGAVFVPLSPADPPARRARLLEMATPTLVVSHDDGGAAAGATGSARDLEGAVRPTALLARRDGTRPPRTRDPRRDAYMIHTSGTTGAPKGIRTPEAAFRAAVTSAALALGLHATTRTLCVSPFHFDGSYGTAFSTLVAGGAIVIPPPEELRFGRRFYTSVLDEHITHTGFTPSYLRLLLASPRVDDLRHSALETLGLGGEQCTAADIAQLWEVLPDLRVFNRYGPTEATIEATTYEIGRADVASGRVPIGTPHPGVRFYLARPDGTIVRGPSETGELLIGGTQLMRGYWGDEALTTSVLHHHRQAGERVLRTGDLAYRDPKGRYVHVGRRDAILKRRGVRISLDEIALAFRRLENVANAACVASSEEGGPAVVAFVVAAPEARPAALLAAAAEQLPEGMLPDDVVVVGSLPLAGSGKVDLHRLRQMADRRPPHHSGPRVA